MCVKTWTDTGMTGIVQTVFRAEIDPPIPLTMHVEFNPLPTDVGDPVTLTLEIRAIQTS